MIRKYFKTNITIVILLYIPLLVLFITSPPFFFSSRFNLKGINKIIIVLSCLPFIIVMLQENKITQNQFILLFLSFSQISLLFVFAILHNYFGYEFEYGYIKIAIQLFVGLIVLISLASINRFDIFANLWINLHIIFGVMGIILFIIGIINGIEPLKIFGERPYYDFGLSYTNSFYVINKIKIIRVAGFYDEPGTYAFFVTLTLILARIYRVKKWKEYILIISGLTSLSLAFMIILPIWMLTMYPLRDLKKYLIVIIILLAVIIYLPDDNVKNKIYTLTIKRMMPLKENKDRIIVGDNRTKIMRENFIAFKEKPLIGHGINYKKNLNDRYKYSFIANPIAPLAKHGLFGFGIYFLHIFLLLEIIIKSNQLLSKEKMSFILILVLTLVQRPHTIVGAVGYMVYMVIIEKLSKSLNMIKIKEKK